MLARVYIQTSFCQALVPLPPSLTTTPNRPNTVQHMLYPRERPSRRYQGGLFSKPSPHSSQHTTKPATNTTRHASGPHSPDPPVTTNQSQPKALSPTRRPSPISRLPISTSPAAVSVYSRSPSDSFPLSRRVLTRARHFGLQSDHAMDLSGRTAINHRPSPGFMDLPLGRIRCLC